MKRFSTMALFAPGYLDERLRQMAPQNNPCNHCLENTRRPDVNSEFNLLNANLMA
jgi:hypothetical protein